MIATIEGLLESLDGDRALITPPGGITYELLLPSFTAARLGNRLGQNVRLCTLYFLESQNQGSTIFPRLAGFLTPEDRAFYELFVTCKGIGHRRALRAMALAPAQIAAAITDHDLALLQTLPEVGRRTAETLAATLRGKVDRFLTTGSALAQKADGSPQPAPGRSVAREVLEVLLQLGEKRTEAVAWIDQVLARDDAPDDAEAVLAEVYRIKSRS
jgi:Holliday junction DNA helicase RuvA